MIEEFSKLRADILARTREFTRQRLAATQGSSIPYAGRVYDEEDVVAGVNAMLDFWLTLGPEGDGFEHELADCLGVRSSVLVNSGSSANLVAVASLTSRMLGDRRIKPGDEVITAAAGFPTTVAPIIQNGAVPVFIDSDPITGNARVEQLEDAYAPGRTKAVMLAHMLGNPFNLREVVRFCNDRHLWLIEDNCDALGAQYDGRLTGAFGALSTQSFYPPHHITTGEGGAVSVVGEARLMKLVESFRDWGRDCWCPSGKDNTCGKRFGWALGALPAGYDHKYIYSHLGYNLKPTDPQAAIGRVQLKKLPSFIAARRANWQRLRAALAPLEDRVDFMLPTHAAGWNSGDFSWASGMPTVNPSWFGFMMLIKPGGAISRNDLARRLDVIKIGNRMLFGGNLTRQPAFMALEAQFASGELARVPYRIVSDLAGADRLMNEALFVGVYPGLAAEQIDRMAAHISKLVRP